MVGSYLVLNPFRLTVLATKLEDYTTAQQHLQYLIHIVSRVIGIIALRGVAFLQKHKTMRFIHRKQNDLRISKTGHKND